MYSTAVCQSKKYSTNYLKCIFCKEEGNVVQSPNPNSYLTVQAAANRRKDNVTEKFEILHNPNSNKQTFSWHRDCFSTYINERAILQREKILENFNENPKIYPAQPLRPSMNKSMPAETIANHNNIRLPLRERNIIEKKIEFKCIICNGFLKKHTLSSYSVLNEKGAETLLNIARLKQDDVFTRIGFFDSVKSIAAKNFQYHKICFYDYKYIPCENSRKRGRLSNGIPNEIIKDAFDKVCKKIDFNNNMFELTFLTEQVNDFFKSEDKTHCIDNRQMKDFLTEEYGEKVLFSQSRCKNQSAIVIVMNISIQQLVERIRQLDNIESKVQDVTDALKKEVDAIEFQTMKTYVCDNEVIDKYMNTFKLPRIWHLFFKLLFCNKHVLENLKLIRAKSLFMDFCYIMQKIHNPKSIALAETVHFLFRSKHLINILWKLGHCISYNELAELNNFILKKQLLNENGKLIIPYNIVKDNPQLSLSGAGDNNDFAEETLNGKGTSHFTSMNLYQEKSSDLPRYFNITTKEAVKDVAIDLLACLPIENFVITNAKPRFANTYKDMQQLKYKTDHYTEMIWVLSKLKVITAVDKNDKLCRDPDNVIPNWSPFTQFLTTTNQPVSVVGYCTALPHPPTSDNVVYTAMKNFHTLCEKCGKEYSVLTADLGIYLRAKKIQMQTPNPFPKMILRIGTFHLQNTWIQCLGQFLEGCGIEDIMVTDLELYGDNSFKSILHGMNYNRGVRLHKLIYESVRSLQVFEYFKSCNNFDLVSFLSLPQFNLLRESIVDGDKMNAKKIYQQLCESNESEVFLQKFHCFIEKKCKENETFLYYNMYCEMFEILLDSLKSDRLGDYDLHLKSTVEMLPYFFSMNHHLYARGVVLYLQDMLNAPEVVISDLKRGMTSVRRNNGEFNGVGGDLALEQTQNRTSAVPGGWIGISKKENALQKWILLHPIKSSIYHFLLSFCEMDDDPFDNDIDVFSHKEWGAQRMKKDDEDVKKIIDSLSSKNVFDNITEFTRLHNVCTGRLAPENIASYLLSVKTSGEKMLQEFISERLENKEKSIFDSMSRVAVKNFNYEENSKKKKEDKKLTNTKELLDVQQIIMLLVQRGYTAEQFAGFELLHYPKSLAFSDGFYKKSKKSQLMEEIDNCSKCTLNFNIASPYKKMHIIDGIVLVHLFINKYSTFDKLAEAFYNHVTSFYNDPNVYRIDVVFDRYDDLGIKYLESLDRSYGMILCDIIIKNDTTKIPSDTKTFMANPKNKHELVKFLCENALKYAKLKPGQQLIISGGFEDIENCYKLQDNTLVEIPELHSNHLEADTRIFAHAAYDVKSDSEIIIHSVDTDVFVLAIYFWHVFFKVNGCKGIFLQIRNQKPRTLGCHIAAEYLTLEVCLILLALHAITGCDSTSKIGTKKKALDIVKSEETYLSTLLTFGDLESNFDDQFQILEQLYLTLMGKSGQTADEARKLIFNRNSGLGVNLATTPCTSDALYQDFLRCFAQTYIWKNAIISYYKPIDLTKYGFYVSETGGLLPQFMTKNPLPDGLVKPCNCRKNCKTMACNCKKNYVSCIPHLCGCDVDCCENKWI